MSRRHFSSCYCCLYCCCWRLKKFLSAFLCAQMCVIQLVRDKNGSKIIFPFVVQERKANLIYGEPFWGIQAGNNFLLLTKKCLKKFHIIEIQTMFTVVIWVWFSLKTSQLFPFSAIIRPNRQTYMRWWKEHTQKKL